MSRHSLFTHPYRGGYIHGEGGTEACRWQWRDHSGKASAYRAAQMRITLLENVSGRISKDNPPIVAVR